MLGVFRIGSIRVFCFLGKMRLKERLTKVFRSFFSIIFFYFLEVWVGVLSIGEGMNIGLNGWFSDSVCGMLMSSVLGFVFRMSVVDFDSIISYVFYFLMFDLWGFVNFGGICKERVKDFFLRIFFECKSNI